MSDDSKDKGCAVQKDAGLAGKYMPSHQRNAKRQENKRKSRIAHQERKRKEAEQQSVNSLPVPSDGKPGDLQASAFPPFEP
ncbi:hypothetical protein LTR37_009275 [Vermiconidia calcicola]|uniref:Uncharacterized protein n=1 Tax=Vermiconidia calcicola TaxID=1690605 RepID=A0ACC3N8Q4_9PEZI|nr:hypothetical protein LTR37_009275 [Vermiconidia calcicola]